MQSHFIKLVSKGVWSEDLKKYPNTPEHIIKYPELYKFIYNGYECELKRNLMLAWCGYVTVPSDHKDYNKDYDDINIDVHGGITYSSFGTFGFDCIHGGDLSPEINHPLVYRPSCNTFGTYKDYAFVVNEIKKMADEFKKREAISDTDTD